MYRTLIFTPLFSSGRAWLINILLELNIRVEQPGKGVTWENNEFGSRMTPGEFERNNQILPAILRRKYIRFRENYEVTWQHSLPIPTSDFDNIILWLRDPRDAVYSFWRRNLRTRFTAEMGDYHSFLNQPSTWFHHFPGLFGLPPAETWSIAVRHALAAKNVMKGSVYFFEDAKANPTSVFIELVKRIGIEISKPEVEQALENSDLKIWKNLQSLSGDHVYSSGTPNAWQDRNDPVENEIFKTAALNTLSAARQHSDGVFSELGEYKVRSEYLEAKSLLNTVAGREQLSVLKFINVPDHEHVFERAAHVASAWVSHQKKQDDFEENRAADMALLNFDWLLNFRENERVASLLNHQFYDF